MSTLNAHAHTTLDEREKKRFNELTKQSYKRVYRVAYELAGNRQDAEDLTQQAFYCAYRAHRKIRDTINQIRKEGQTPAARSVGAFELATS